VKKIGFDEASNDLIPVLKNKIKKIEDRIEDLKNRENTLKLI